MNVPRTSAITYEKIKKSGLLRKISEQVYDIIYSHPDGITRGELKKTMSATTDYKGATEPWVNTLYSLKKRGVVMVIGERLCSVTNNLCQIWVTNDNLPVKIEKPVRALTAEELIEVSEYLRTLVDHKQPKSIKRFLDWAEYKVQKEQV